MKLQYKPEHRECSLYATDETAVFRCLDLQAGDDLSGKGWQQNVLIYVAEGLVTLYPAQADVVSIGSGQLLYACSGLYATARAEVPTRAVTCNLPLHCHLCHSYGLSQLYDDTVGSGSCTTPATYRAAGANGRLRLFFDNVAEVLADGLGCMRYHQIKSEELLLLLRGYYTKEELCAVFHDAMRQGSEFRQFVLQHYRQVSDVTEFASLANMSLRNFQRKFRAEFSCAAREWLLARKAEAVLQALQTSDKDIMTIATEHGFSAMSYFSTFCKHNLGKTPTELRGRDRQEACRQGAACCRTAAAETIALQPAAAGGACRYGRHE